MFTRLRFLATSGLLAVTIGPLAAQEIPTSQVVSPPDALDGLPVAQAGPEGIEGAAEAAQRIQQLDQQLALRQAELKPSVYQAAAEFRDLAAYQLAEGLADGQLSWRDRYNVNRFVQTAQFVVQRPRRDRVTTYIRAPEASWSLAFVTLEEFHNRGQDWRPYSYGNPMDIKTYVFRLSGTRSGAPVECTRTVPIWDDPTSYSLGC